MEAVPSNSGGHPRAPNTPTLCEVDCMLAPFSGPSKLLLARGDLGRPRLPSFVTLAGSVGCALGLSFRDLDGFGGDGRGFCPVIKMSLTPHWGPIFRDILEL